MNLGSIPLQNTSSSSFDLESNSQLSENITAAPSPSLNLLEPDLSISLPVQHIINSINPLLDNQANLSSPLTIIGSSPPTNLTLQALNTAINGPPLEHDHAHTAWLQYLLFVGGVCYAAVSATLQALQGTMPLSTTSKIVYAALLVSFIFFVFSIYIRTKYPRASTIAVHVGSLFGFAAFFVALFSSLTRRH